ncbi:MAG: M1 family metallopeptidase [Deltaproteobacteria bacterium]|nr:M1 family metallopeptidase [Deltaproteobacteria bacterium]
MSLVNPVNYKIRIEPDLQRFKFWGKVEILAEAKGPTKEIRLNVLSLAVLRCSVSEDGVNKEARFLVDPQKEELVIFLPHEVSGLVSVLIDYAGEISDNMAGFYKSKYVLGRKESYIAVTQFQESDARRAFPCFDHPSRKATFDLELVIPAELVAISNQPVLKEENLNEQRKLVKFVQTPKMSTYLLFFAVGMFEFMEKTNKTLLRVATTPGKVKQGTFSLDFARKCLDFCEQYYGIKYPLPKLDLIAIADFAAGAMENWGAITFRENLVLHDPDTTSRAGEERICTVIAHEIIHQWFGNLVTPADWKFLWLNESFATYFGYRLADHYYPDWDVWGRFLYTETETALDRDALWENFPIEIPGGEHVVINVSTAPIIYSKGGSLLRAIEGYIGEENFKEGLRRYLKEYEYACASSHDLWEAFGQASDIPVSNIMKSWVEQPGFPIVEVERDSNQLILKQERFTYLPGKSAQKWRIPISVRIFFDNGGVKTLKALLEKRSMAIELEPGVTAYKINHAARGFYIVKYADRENLEQLAGLVKQKSLSPEDRWGIQRDLYALVKRGDISLDYYLSFLNNYSKENDFLPLMSIATNLHHAYLVVGETKGERIEAVGRKIFENALSLIGCEPKPEEKRSISMLRDELLWMAAMFGSKEAQNFGEAKFSALLKGEKIAPDITKSIMKIGAFYGNERTFEWFDEKLRSSQSEHERINILEALGCFPEKGLIERAQQYVLDNVPERNKFVPVRIMAGNRGAVPLMWEWYVNSISRFEQLHPVHYERVVAAIVPVCGLGKEEEVREFITQYIEEKGKAKQVLKLSLERLEVNSLMRKNNK